MRLKFLLIALLFVGVLNAQDTIRTLIITEARVDRNDQSYVEITNVGEEAVDLGQFKFGRISAWADRWTPEKAVDFLRLPSHSLAPGESFVLAAVRDFTLKMYPLEPDFFNRKVTKDEWWTLADMQIHMPEERTSMAPPGITDSISPYYGIMETWGGRDTWYLEQHFENGDSAVVDQVGGVFDSESGRNQDKNYDVAGVTGAWGTHILVRKASVKQGNINFADARGIDITDSEWIPIPRLFSDWEPYRAVFWTAGHHGDVTLDENTLKSDVLEVNWADKTIKAQWGVRNNDDFMFQFEKVPGLAWHYDLSPAREDSAYNSARTGDKLTIYACGNTLQTEVFEIEVQEPGPGANVVIPKFAPSWNPKGSFFSNDINSGEDAYFDVTVDASEMDTITSGIFGVGYATRADTLLNYLEKAPKASWEIVWVDNIERADVKNGDILKVTAENGDVKEYFIKVNDYRPSHNANLAAITWPDMPEWMRGLFGWKGDTIPAFGPNVLNYTVQLPADVVGIPSFIAKTEQLNATVEVQRATSLTGSDAQKMMKFIVTAEDGNTKKTYNVKLEKETALEDTQPFETDPILSELVFWEQWGNGFVEVFNPGNQRLDLSNYMFVFTYSDQIGAIEGYSDVDDWSDRYIKYVPGYKWVDEATWAVSPGRLVEDLNVSPFVEAHDVFVMGDIRVTGNSGYPWFASEQCDVIFNTDYNPWDEVINGDGSAARQWSGANFYIFKILNDSIKQGEKPANDLNDFELIEVFGHGDETDWVIGGVQAQMITNYIRKPEYWQGKTSFAESFGTDREDAEWTWTNESYWQSEGYGWPQYILMVTSDLGKHHANPVTIYMSTISSEVYKLSEGYKTESMWGILTGTNAEQFLANIIKKDEGQTLSVKSQEDGSELSGADILSLNDTLVVVSADGNNTTKYVLNISEDGLSSDAVLTSTAYTIDIDGAAGSVSGFDYGTKLSTVLDNVTVPEGAVLSIIDGDGAYVSMNRLNFDTVYVDVNVNPNIYFDVIAEDGMTKIVYQLLPVSTDDDAFILSDVYSVSQEENLVSYVPGGTTVATLLSNVVPALNAEVKVVDKFGNERTSGNVYLDDKIVVTSGSGLVTRAYHLAMLSTAMIPDPVYLAYVLSDKYDVDQLSYQISGIDKDSSLEDFFSDLYPAWGATVRLVDKDGNEKTSGTVGGFDILQVTSADGKIVVTYHLAVTAVEEFNKARILIYPNPTSDNFIVNGVERGDRIQVFSSTGTVVRDIVVESTRQIIHLEREAPGMYLIVISNNNQLIGRYKALKK